MKPDESGINMVDLMMWLVIAALLLAAALQGIGYYQKNAYLYQMKSDTQQAGTNAIRQLSMSTNLTMDSATITTARDESEWTEGVSSAVAIPSNLLRTPYLRTTHPSVTDKDVLYLFEDCTTGLQEGVNVVPKGTVPSMDKCTITPPAPPQVTLTTIPDVRTSERSMDSIDASADGKYVVAGIRDSGGGMFLSSDYGKTFDKLAVSPDKYWEGVAISGDGSKIFAVSSDIGIVGAMSTDFGQTWVKPTMSINGSKSDAAMSNDGSVIAVSGADRKFWISTNGGSTFREVSTSGKSWTAVDMTSDGTTIIMSSTPYTNTGVPQPGEITISRDKGQTWTTLPGTLGRNWYSASISDDGMKIAATEVDGTTYKATNRVSLDGGETFTNSRDSAKISGVTESCTTIEYSPDGKVLAVGCASNGGYYISYDDGVTWKRSETSNKKGNWAGFAFSNDSKYFYGTNTWFATPFAGSTR